MRSHEDSASDQNQESRRDYGIRDDLREQESNEGRQGGGDQAINKGSETSKDQRATRISKAKKIREQSELEKGDEG